MRVGTPLACALFDTVSVFYLLRDFRGFVMYILGIETSFRKFLDSSGTIKRQTERPVKVR